MVAPVCTVPPRGLLSFEGHGSSRAPFCPTAGAFHNKWLTTKTGDPDSGEGAGTGLLRGSMHGNTPGSRITHRITTPRHRRADRHSGNTYRTARHLQSRNPTSSHAPLAAILAGHLLSLVFVWLPAWLRCLFWLLGSQIDLSHSLMRNAQPLANGFKRQAFDITQMQNRCLALVRFRHGDLGVVPLTETQLR